MGVLGMPNLKQILKPIANQNQEYFYSSKKRQEPSSKFIFNKNHILGQNEVEEQRFTTISSFFPDQYLSNSNNAEKKPNKNENLFKSNDAFDSKNNTSPNQKLGDQNKFGGFGYFPTPYNNKHGKSISIPHPNQNRVSSNNFDSGLIDPKVGSKNISGGDRSAFGNFRGSFSQKIDQTPDTPVFKIGDSKGAQALLGKREMTEEVSKEKNNDISFQYFAFSKGATKVDKIGNIQEQKKIQGNHFFLTGD